MKPNNLENENVMTKKNVTPSNSYGASARKEAERHAGNQVERRVKKRLEYVE